MCIGGMDGEKEEVGEGIWEEVRLKELSDGKCVQTWC